MMAKVPAVMLTNGDADFSHNAFIAPFSTALMIAKVPAVMPTNGDADFSYNAFIPPFSTIFFESNFTFCHAARYIICRDGQVQRDVHQVRFWSL